MVPLVRYSDDVIKGKWAAIRMADDNPYFIAIGPRSIVIKKSKKGVLGRKLFEVRNNDLIEQMTSWLSVQYCVDLTPKEMTNGWLRPIVNAALHCQQLEQVINLLSDVQINADQSQIILKSTERARNLPLNRQSPS